MAGEVNGISFKLIVAGVDGSPSSLKAANHAILLAKLADARLQFIYVVDTHIAFQLGTYQQLALETMEQDGENAIAEVMRSAREAGVKDINGEVISGSPRTIIVNWAKEHEASLIIVGSHGYSRLTYLLIGSVADYVVHYAHCPVLVVRG